MKRFTLLLAVLLWASLAAASTYAKDYGDVSVIVETVTGAPSMIGYEEYRAIIINHSLTKSHRVTVEINMSYSPDQARRTVEVAPSSAMTIPLLCLGNVSGAPAGLLIDGERQVPGVNIETSRTSAWVSRSDNRFFLLISPGIDKIGLMNDAAVVEGFKNGAGQDDVAHLDYKSPMPEWSENWVAYSGFDAVVITAEELREAPAGARSALWAFAECGGSLLIISAGGAWEIPEQWRSRRVEMVEVEDEDEASKKAPRTFLFAGSAPVRSIPEKTASKTHPVTLSKVIHSYNVGFGNATVLDAASLKSILPAQWGAIKAGWRRSRPSEKPYRDIVEINNDFPVIERIGIPVRGLFVLMLMFVIVIGPINLIWLARRRRKIWMLWTVPAIALLTCSAVTGFALFREGVRAMSRAETFTILDESSHRASTIGWMAFYAPLTPSGGLHFSFDTELAPVRADLWYSYRREGIRTIDLSNDQHLDSGWIMARVPVYFRFRKSETRRERLTIRREGDIAISVVNGLGADVHALWLADRDGKVYSASGIQAGAEAKLTPAPLTPADNPSGLRELFASNFWPGKMKEVAANPRYFLAPGCYMATLDASPFVEEGLKNVRTRKGSSLIYGLSAPVAKEER
ncbi:MAG: hypothetical protein J2P21_13290 [Chloracidobacterium sp.]|nr:hypothetical protein [Chloracidobacterium sp.]